MLGTQYRYFSALNKSVVVMANSSSADMVGGKLMDRLKTVSGVDDFDFFGYGADRMQNEGLDTSEFDVSNFLDKAFYTFRKTKTLDETYFVRYNPFNLINKHYTRSVNDIFREFEANDLPRRIF